MAVDSFRSATVSLEPRRFDMPTVEKTLTPQEAGEVLQLHAKTVIRFAEAGKIPGKKFGNRWRFVPSVLEAYLRGEVITYTGRP
jgi:excisionase family DNA binding protein